jgi:hypothetical protein
MTHEEIVRGLTQLGHNGWVLYGDDYENIIWESDTPKPSLAAVKTANDLAVTNLATAKANVLAKLGLTADEVAALLG